MASSETSAERDPFMDFASAEAETKDSRQNSHNDDEGQLKQPSRLPGSLQRASTTPDLSAASSTTSSPKSSRQPSPVRPQPKTAISANSRLTRSRKNSQDFSPNRGPSTANSHFSTVPSAAAIQRALSVAGTPQLQPSGTQDAKGDTNKQQQPKLAKASSLTAQASGIPPRLKSPPPPISASKASLAPQKTFESAPTTPSIVLERTTALTKASTELVADGDKDTRSSGMRTPVRGISAAGPTLETVQESSLPATPALGTGRSQHGKQSSGERPGTIQENPMEHITAIAKAQKFHIESGNENIISQVATRSTSDITKDIPKSAPPAITGKPQIHPKKSFTQLLPTKAKISEGSAKNMIVETETVSTIPQVALGGGAGERSITGRTDTGGSLRLKPSNETIRPKKEKKKVVRKAPSINSGTGGFQSRHFHHHHIYSRAPSPEYLISLSPCSPEFSLNRGLERGPLRSATHPSSDWGDHAIGDRVYCDSVDNVAIRPNSAVLTTFRGRTASSKADIFEQKVANAIDQTNSSDSEETFVYESNPPEPPLSARPHRFHSRTPSATSTVSQLDQHGRMRQDGHHSIAGKKSMKFANNSYHSINLQGDVDQGTVRRLSNGQPGNASHHHYIGRHGRGGGGHTSLFDNNSPFNSTNKQVRTPTGNVARLSSRPTTPRSPHIRVSGTLRKTDEPLLYDMEGEGADDERAPLIGSIRSGKNRRRPIPGTLRNGYAVEQNGYRVCRPITAYTSLGGLLALIIAAIVVALTMCSKPLFEVHIKDIRNVLASEQEIMLDLHVRAVNPNIIAVQVSDLDVNIFAKSKHVGTSALWRNGEMQSSKGPTGRGKRIAEDTAHRINHRRSPHDYRTADGVDEGTDPIEDPETDAQTMLLGRIFEFDSPLIFEPSPIMHRSLSSMGEVRLAKPGNKTEEGGTARWEKVILHDFELIVRGVIRYSLPISSRTRSASIGGSVLVHPGEGLDPTGSMITSRPRRPYAPGSNVPLSKPGGALSSRARLAP